MHVKGRVSGPAVLASFLLVQPSPFTPELEILIRGGCCRDGFERISMYHTHTLDYIYTLYGKMLSLIYFLLMFTYLCTVLVIKYQIPNSYYTPDKCNLPWINGFFFQCSTTSNGSLESNFNMNRFQRWNWSRNDFVRWKWFFFFNNENGPHAIR